MLATALLAAILSHAADPPKNPFEFADGDRVVFLGGTLIEREQKYGYWELALTLLNKDKNVAFRNLGWSGDTVWCESRGSFDGPKKGFERTVELVKELKPTVIVICYGHVESFDGKDGVPKFTEGLEKLIDAVSVTKARVVLMTPTRYEDVGKVSASKNNANLKLYVKAIEEVAEKRKLGLGDLFGRSMHYSDTMTENGVHLHDHSYWATAGWLFASEAWEKNHASDHPLLKAIIAKNELFFHRWRPQNLTYLTGFRKHEQGNNAKEIVQFDPLVEKAEQEIAELRRKVK